MTIACDSQHDRDLYADTLEGNMPENFVGWTDLRPLAEKPAFNAAMMRYRHALHNTNANRADWLALP